MNYFNKKPTIFFATILIFFFLIFGAFFVWLSLNYLNTGAEVVNSQTNDFLLVETASQISSDWNKIFLLMDQALNEQSYRLNPEQEKFYLDQSKYNLQTLKDYYSPGAGNYGKNLALAGGFLNISRDVNLLESYFSQFSEYLNAGEIAKADNLRYQEISQSQGSLNTNINLFIDKVKQQNYFVGQEIIVKQSHYLSRFLWIFLIYFLLTLTIPLLIYYFVKSYFKNLKQSIYRAMTGDLTQLLRENLGPLEFAEINKMFNKMLAKFQEINHNFAASIKEKSLEIDRKSAELEKQELSLQEQQDNMAKTKSSIMNVLEDVNEERTKSDLLAQDLEKFKLAVDNASDYIVITDADGIIIYANKGLERITGFKVTEVIGQKIGAKTLWGGNMPTEFYQKLWETVKTNKSDLATEFNNHRKNGDSFVAATSISPILNNANEVEFFVSIGRDITVAKRIDVAKTEFVSLASHQLRTPLTSVKWHAEMLLEGDAEPLAPDQKDFTQEIYNSNERMIDLVDSLLDVSRLDLGTLKVEGVPTNISELVKDLVNEVGPLLAKKKVKLIEKYDKDLPIVELDKKMSFMVIQNLLTNAIKYSKVGGEVVIEIKRDGSDQVLIKLVDNGYGIPLKDQSQIAVKLFRADNARKTEPDGNGLGLYIVKAVAIQAGGKFWFESKEGVGLTFYVSLPVKLPKK